MPGVAQPPARLACFTACSSCLYYWVPGSVYVKPLQDPRSKIVKIVEAMMLYQSTQLRVDIRGAFHSLEKYKLLIEGVPGFKTCNFVTKRQVNTNAKKVLLILLKSKMLKDRRSTLMISFFSVINLVDLANIFL